MAPVATLIVVRPRIEVNAVEGDSLDADAYRENARAHFPVETVLVHAEVGGGVAHADEAGRRRGLRRKAGMLGAHLRRTAAAGK
jgi:hypothetical protein